MSMDGISNTVKAEDHSVFSTPALGGPGLGGPGLGGSQCFPEGGEGTKSRNRLVH